MGETATNNPALPVSAIQVNGGIAYLLQRVDTPKGTFFIVPPIQDHDEANQHTVENQKKIAHLLRYFSAGLLKSDPTLAQKIARKVANNDNIRLFDFCYDTNLGDEAAKRITGGNYPAIYYKDTQGLLVIADKKGEVQTVLAFERSGKQATIVGRADVKPELNHLLVSRQAASWKPEGKPLLFTIQDNGVPESTSLQSMITQLPNIAQQKQGNANAPAALGELPRPQTPDNRGASTNTITRL